MNYLRGLILGMFFVLTITPAFCASSRDVASRPGVVSVMEADDIHTPESTNVTNRAAVNSARSQSNTRNTSASRAGNTARRESATTKRETTNRTTQSRTTNAGARATQSRTARTASSRTPTVTARSASTQVRSASNTRAARSATNAIGTSQGATKNAVKSRTATAGKSRATSNTITRARTTSATALINSDVSGMMEYCKTQYTQCMDNFCDVLDDAQGRCSCSKNIKNYAKTSTAQKEANAALQDIAQQIQYIGLSRDEVETLFTQTEAELTMQGNTDNSQIKNSLDKIKEMIVDVKPGTAVSTETDSSFSFNLDGLLDFNLDSVGFDLASIFGNSNSGTSSISNQRGEQLYKTASARCKKSVLESCQAQGINITLIENSYDLEIDRACIAYERSLSDGNDDIVQTVRNAQTVLQRARLMVEQQKNVYDLRGCVGALDACMQDDFVCGSDYELCLDPTGKYIVEGEVVVGSTPGYVIEGASSVPPSKEYANNTLMGTWYYDGKFAWGATTQDGSLMDYISKYVTSNPIRNTSSNMAEFLQHKIGYNEKGKNYGMCMSVLNKCQNLTYDKKTGNYIPNNQVITEYLARTLVQIKRAQDAVLTDYAESCITDVSSCLSTNNFDTTASNSKQNIAINACRSQIKTCMSVNGNSASEPDPADLRNWVMAMMGALLDEDIPSGGNSGGSTGGNSGTQPGQSSTPTNNPYTQTNPKSPMLIQAHLTDVSTGAKIAVYEDTQTNACYANPANTSNVNDACVVKCDISSASSGICNPNNTVTLTVDNASAVSTYALRSGVSLTFNGLNTSSIKIALENGQLPSSLGWVRDLSNNTNYRFDGIVGPDGTEYYDKNGNRVRTGITAGTTLTAVYAYDGYKQACVDSGGTWQNESCSCTATGTIYDEETAACMCNVAENFTGTPTLMGCQCADGFEFANGTCRQKESGGTTPDQPEPDQPSPEQTACTNAGGTWNGTTCDCGAGKEWNGTACVSTGGTTPDQPEPDQPSAEQIACENDEYGTWTNGRGCVCSGKLTWYNNKCISYGQKECGDDETYMEDSYGFVSVGNSGTEDIYITYYGGGAADMEQYNNGVVNLPVTPTLAFYARQLGRTVNLSDWFVKDANGQVLTMPCHVIRTEGGDNHYHCRGMCMATQELQNICLASGGQWNDDECVQCQGQGRIPGSLKDFFVTGNKTYTCACNVEYMWEADSKHSNSCVCPKYKSYLTDDAGIQLQPMTAQDMYSGLDWDADETVVWDGVDKCVLPGTLIVHADPAEANKFHADYYWACDTKHGFEEGTSPNHGASITPSGSGYYWNLFNVLLSWRDFGGNSTKELNPACQCKAGLTQIYDTTLQKHVCVADETVYRKCTAVYDFVQQECKCSNSNMTWNGTTCVSTGGTTPDQPEPEQYSFAQWCNAEGKETYHEPGTLSADGVCTFENTSYNGGNANPFKFIKHATWQIVDTAVAKNQCLINGGFVHQYLQDNSKLTICACPDTETTGGNALAERENGVCKCMPSFVRDTAHAPYDCICPSGMQKSATLLMMDKVIDHTDDSLTIERLRRNYLGNANLQVNVHTGDFAGDVSAQTRLYDKNGSPITMPCSLYESVNASNGGHAFWMCKPTCTPIDTFKRVCEATNGNWNAASNECSCDASAGLIWKDKMLPHCTCRTGSIYGGFKKDSFNPATGSCECDSDREKWVFSDGEAKCVPIGSYCDDKTKACRCDASKNFTESSRVDTEMNADGYYYLNYGGHMTEDPSYHFGCRCKVGYEMVQGPDGKMVCKSGNEPDVPTQPSAEQTACTNAGGTWNGTTCECAYGYSWDSNNATCVSLCAANETPMEVNDTIYCVVVDDPEPNDSTVPNSITVLNTDAGRSTISMLLKDNISGACYYAFSGSYNPSGANDEYARSYTTTENGRTVRHMTPKYNVGITLDANGKRYAPNVKNIACTDPWKTSPTLTTKMYLLAFKKNSDGTYSKTTENLPKLTYNGQAVDYVNVGNNPSEMHWASQIAMTQKKPYKYKGIYAKDYYFYDEWVARYYNKEWANHTQTIGINTKEMYLQFLYSDNYASCQASNGRICLYKTDSASNIEKLTCDWPNIGNTAPGTWLYFEQDICKCQTGSADINKWSCTASAEEQACQRLNKEWINGTCDCGDGYQWQDQMCKSHAQAGCEATGGNWVADQCSCDAGKVLLKDSFGIPSGDTEDIYLEYYGGNVEDMAAHNNTVIDIPVVASAPFYAKQLGHNVTLGDWFLRDENDQVVMMSCDLFRWDEADKHYHCRSMCMETQELQNICQMSGGQWNGDECTQCSGQGRIPGSLKDFFVTGHKTNTCACNVEYMWEADPNKSNSCRCTTYVSRLTGTSGVQLQPMTAEDMYSGLDWDADETVVWDGVDKCVLPGTLIVHADPAEANNRHADYYWACDVKHGFEEGTSPLHGNSLPASGYGYYSDIYDVLLRWRDKNGNNVLELDPACQCKAGLTQVYDAVKQKHICVTDESVYRNCGYDNYDFTNQVCKSQE